MIVAIMQPYFFPYIGYFQLMKAADMFVLYDDVQYVKRGWINRNKIALNGRAAWLTLPVLRDEVTTAINQRYYCPDSNGLEQVRNRIDAAYGKNAAYMTIAPLVFGLIAHHDANVARYNANLLIELGRLFKTDCTFAFSSQIEKPDGLKGEAKVIELCRALGATHYINPIGGLELYDPASFHKAGLELSFLKTRVPPISLPDGAQHLSIIDSLMRYGLDQCIAQTSQYAVLDRCAAQAETSGATA